MRDYYSEYLGKKLQDTPVKEVSKVSKGCSSHGNIPFDTFDTSFPYGIPEIFGSQFSSLDADSRQQLLFEIEERIAIMMFDGGLSETDANAAAVADVLRGWFGLLG